MDRDGPESGDSGPSFRYPGVATPNQGATRMTETIPVSFTCKKCGAKLTWSDDATDQTRISCVNCGQYFGTYGDLRHTAVEGLKAKIERSFKDLFKGR